VNVTFSGGSAAVVCAGLMVGIGPRRVAGCTAGDGVCGGARLSLRSFAAMGTFMAVAMATVAVGNLL